MPAGDKGADAPPDLEVFHYGEGSPVWLIHGAVLDGPASWSRQLRLAERWRLGIVNRPGFGGSRPTERTDWHREGAKLASALDAPVHLVAHSYGTLVALVACAIRPDAVRSLVLVEPPAFSLLGADDREAVAFMEEVEQMRVRHADDPYAALVEFGHLLGLPAPPAGDLPRAVVAGVQLLLGERLPWEGEIPVADVRASTAAKLVVTCTESPLRLRAAQALARAIEADVSMLAGGHNLQRRGDAFNVMLEHFLDEVESSA